VAFGRGGLFGVGLGNGQQKLAYLPEAHTDFILALVAEEMGLAGILMVLVAFAVLMLAGTRIAQNRKDRFALLLAFGMTTLLTVPAVINAAVVMGLLPTKGLTLPFLSYGRTSLIMNCAALGLLLGLAKPEKPRSAATTGVKAWP
jgi:cell division protein FtsW